MVSCWARIVHISGVIFEKEFWVDMVGVDIGGGEGDGGMDILEWYIWRASAQLMEMRLISDGVSLGVEEEDWWGNGCGGSGGVASGIWLVARWFHSTDIWESMCTLTDVRSVSNVYSSRLECCRSHRRAALRAVIPEGVGKNTWCVSDDAEGFMVFPIE